MKIIWLGHASFRLEIADETILIDPWLTGNPLFPDGQMDQALAGVTHILMTHGHFDHASELNEIAKKTGATICGIPELCGAFADAGLPTIDFNKGGTIQIGDVAVSMVSASHSSSMKTSNGDKYAGTEAGFMIEAEGHTIYISGDTDIMADMDWMGDFYNPDIGILCAGGHYTMGMKGAAYAAKRYFNFKTVIPCHYRTFPLLEQSAKELVNGLPGVNVIEPQVMEAIEL